MEKMLADFKQFFKFHWIVGGTRRGRSCTKGRRGKTSIWIARSPGGFFVQKLTYYYMLRWKRFPKVLIIVFFVWSQGLRKWNMNIGEILAMSISIDEKLCKGLLSTEELLRRPFLNLFWRYDIQHVFNFRRSLIDPLDLEELLQL